MGLYVSHGCWRGPYTAFMRFRRTIARVVGIPYDLMEGVGDPFLPLQVTNVHTGSRVAVSDSLPIPWEILKPDPILALLNHSDQEGEIDVADLLPLADRLDEISEACGEWTASVRAFAAGCRRAAAAQEPVTFH